VVTTSGIATGVAADTEKVHKMKSSVGRTPLCVASGINATNIYDYLPHVDCFIVATGVSDSFHELSVPKMRALVEILANSKRTS